MHVKLVFVCENGYLVGENVIVVGKSCIIVVDGLLLNAFLFGYHFKVFYYPAGLRCA